MCEDGLTPSAASSGQGRIKDPSVLVSPFRVVAALGCAFATAVATPAIAGADPVGTVTEFSAGITSASEPYDIVAGPDGNLWFTELGGNRVARMTPTGTVTEFPVAVGSGVRGIVPASDGNLWFVTDDGTLSRITPAGVQTGFAAGDAHFGGADPYMVAEGSDGNLWFTNWDYSRISQSTPLGAVTSYSAGITSRPYDIVAGPDGNLWFTEPNANASRIGRITPGGTVTQFPLALGTRPYGITVGPDGNLWFTQRGNDAIGRITPTGTVTEFSVGITPGSTPLAITAGADGNLWFTEFDGNRIGRITPTGTVTEFSAGITPGSAPYGIAAGPDGQIWFTQRAGSRIGRITATEALPPPPPPPPPPVAAGHPCASAAVVLAIAPASGPSGSAVTITGSGLACATGVLFGDIPALGYSIDGDGQISARAPISAPGNVDVRVLSSAGASVIVPGDRFTFTASSTVTGPLAPFTGPLAPTGDRRVLICGRVPTLTRYTLAQARRVLARDHCDVPLRIGGRAPRRGHRRITSQRPAPGTPLYAGDPRPTVRLG
jgi:streptogramin lyase